ncbi:MAG: hypothetical protein AAF928_08180 [Myxococcota bacterium]
MAGGEARFWVAAALVHGVGIPAVAKVAPEVMYRFERRAMAPTEVYEIDTDGSLFAPVENPSSPRFDLGGRDEAGGDGAPRRGVVQRGTEYRPRVPLLPPEADSDLAMPIPGSPEIPADPDGGPAEPDPFGAAPSLGEVNGMGDGMGSYALPSPILPDDGGKVRPAAPTQAPRREYDEDSGNKLVRDGVREGDKKLGLDFPGRGIIRNAFVTAVYSSDAPYQCTANFSVTVNPKGKITDVSLLGYNGGASSTWAAVRKSAKAQLAGASLVMKSGYAKGAIVGVVLRSEERATSNSGGVSRDGAGAKFDISEIGSRRTRYVSAGVNPQPL